MRALVAVLMTLTLWSVALPQTPAAQSTKAVTTVCTLKVTGMTCAGCEAAVKIAAKSVAGVTAVAASYAKGTAEVTYDPAKTTPVAVAKVIAVKTGYKAVPQPQTKQ